MSEEEGGDSSENTVPGALGADEAGTKVQHDGAAASDAGSVGHTVGAASDTDHGDSEGLGDTADAEAGVEEVAIELPVSGRIMELALMFFAACDKRSGVLLTDDPRGSAAFVAGITQEESAELLSFADFLDSPWLVEWSAGLVAKYLGSWEELRDLRFPAHVQAAVLSAASTHVLFQATNSAAARATFDVKAAWVARFRSHVEYDRVQRQRLDLDSFVEHGMFGPKSGRYLTLLPDELQEWYAMVSPTPVFTDTYDEEGKRTGMVRTDDWEPCEQVLNDELPAMYARFHALCAFMSRFPSPPTEAEAAELRQELDEWLAAAPLHGLRPPRVPTVARGGGDTGEAPGGEARPQGVEAARPRGGGGGGGGGGAAGGEGRRAPPGQGDPPADGAPDDAAATEAPRAAAVPLPVTATPPRDVPRTRRGMGGRSRSEGQQLRRGAARDRRTTTQPFVRGVPVSPIRTTSMGPLEILSYSRGAARSGGAMAQVAGAGLRAGAGAGAGAGGGRSPVGLASVAGRGRGRGRPARIGGGFNVHVSKPSRLPSSWRSGRKLNLFGRKSVRGSKRGKSLGSAKASAQETKAAVDIQRVVRGKQSRRAVAEDVRMRIRETGVLPVVPSIVELFACPGLVTGFVKRLAWCTGVMVLDLRGCRELEPDAIPAICQLRRLRYLDLSGCSKCGNDEFAALGVLEHLVTLQACCWNKLDHRGIAGYAARAVHNRLCPAVPPMALAHRASHGVSQRLAVGQAELKTSSLRNLNLADCRALDDSCLNEIGAELPGLEDLCVFSCLRLSDRGLVGLGSLESRLRRFCWAGAYKVTPSGTRFLLGQNPNLLTYNNPNDFHDMRDAIMQGLDAGEA